MADSYPQKHPKGLYVLFFTEMWERFSYYGMQALLMIYMITETQKGGLGWDAHAAGQLYGLYVGLVYFTPLIGGYLADKYLGSRLCVLIGSVLMVLGHFSLAFSPLPAFFSGVGLLILGVGFFKANISSVLGKLYPVGSPLVDAGYTIFYMSINIGSIAGVLICSYLGERVGWHYGFGVAGVGMALSFLIFYFGQGLLGDAGKAPDKKDNEVKIEWNSFTKTEKSKLIALIIISAFSIIFWMAWEQMGASVSIFIKDYTYKRIDFLDFEVPIGWFQALNPLFVTIFAPAMAAVWNYLGKKNLDLSIPLKILLGFVLMMVAFLVLVIAAWGIVPGQSAAAQVSMWYILGFYFFQVIAEICQYPVMLSAVSKLSPKSIYSIMFGMYFVAIAIGNYAAGAITGFIEQVGNEFSLSWFFMLSVIMLAIAAVGLWIYIPRLKKWMEDEPLA